MAMHVRIAYFAVVVPHPHGIAIVCWKDKVHVLSWCGSMTLRHKSVRHEYGLILVVLNLVYNVACFAVW
jgi:hypothetical protein